MLLRDFTCAGQTLWKSRRHALPGVEAGDPAAFLTMSRSSCLLQRRPSGCPDPEPWRSIQLLPCARSDA
jgi:hypothetical protein